MSAKDAARLAGLRRAGVDLERRVRGDVTTTADSGAYWQSQVAGWRAEIEGVLTLYPFQLRAMQGPIATDGEDQGWRAAVLRELIEIRGRLDATIERVRPEE